jgi:hypothetical protein
MVKTKYKENRIPTVAAPTFFPQVSSSEPLYGVEACASRCQALALQRTD